MLIGNSSIADCKGLTIKGNPATNPAITRPLKVKIKEMSNLAKKRAYKAIFSKQQKQEKTNSDGRKYQR